MAESSKNSEGTGTVVLLAVAALALVAVPTALGVGLFLAVRRHLGRRESAALIAVGVIGLVTQARYAFSTYAAWLWQVLQGRFELGAVPWLPLLLMSVIITGLLGALAGTKVASRFGKVLGAGPVKRGSAKADPTAVLPTVDVRQAASAASRIARPTGALSVAAAAHSVLAPQEPGERSFPIGASLNGSPVYLSEKEIRTHGLILGSTGSGKSETIKALAGNLLDLGWSGIVLDLKEDTAPGGLKDWCFEYSQAHSTPFQELCLSNANSATWFNPLDGMGPDEMRDTVLSLNKFEAAYYEALNKELLGQIIMLMTWAHQIDPVKFPTPTMYDIARLCSSGSLSKATRAMRATVQEHIPGVGEADFRALVNPSKAQEESAVGFGSRLGNLYDSQAGRLILRPGGEDGRPQRRSLDITSSGLTYVGLDSQGKPDLTRVISSAMLQRLSVYASMRTTGQVEKGQPRFVIIDEANWINREITQNLLSRARGAGIAMFLCTQGPKDWIDKDGDDWGKLVNNVNVSIIMRQGEPESAELAAEYLGKVEVDKVSEKVMQTRTLLGARAARDQQGRRMESFNVASDWDYRVQPDELRELTIGEAIVRVGSPAQRLEYARIQMRDPRASPRR